MLRIRWLRCLSRGQHGWRRGSPICLKEVGSRPQQPQAICKTRLLQLTSRRRQCGHIQAHRKYSTKYNLPVDGSEQSSGPQEKNTCRRLAPTFRGGKSTTIIYSKSTSCLANVVTGKSTMSPFFAGRRSYAAWASQSCCRKMRRKRCENELKRRGGGGSWVMGYLIFER